MISYKEIEDMFDSISEKCVNEEERTGGVVLGVFSEDDHIGFNAAHGDMATITALITAIIARTAENAEISPYELMMTISLGIDKTRLDIDDEEDDD